MSGRTTYGALAGKANAPRTDPSNKIDGMESISSLPDVLTLEQCCFFLQIAETTARNLCRQKKLPAIKIGGLWRIPKAHLVEFIAGGGICGR